MLPIDDIYQKGACFTAASLFEVCVSPSPGLVNPFDNGAHTDMNLFTFVLGSSVLAPYFTECVATGFQEEEKSLDYVFAKLRAVGVRGEAALLRATAGVNTQRGQLFVLGLAAGVTGVCLAQGIKVPSPEFFSAVKSACSGLTERELAKLEKSDARTAGERLFLHKGYTGVRGEAEAGFPSVERVGYPALLFALCREVSLNDAAVHALLCIMAHLSDTTVLHRAGEAGLAKVQNTAQDILSAGSVFSDSGRSIIRQAHNEFSAARLSPGGSGDLLALSLALYFLEKGLPSPQVLLRPSLFRG
ncbi:MAG: triphosphoribosyl-dephospho-CoA synthase [Selenomonadales bacterium]|jgi:triphosphoribosyl-dephospho-CoA synthetase|nr:triphosphoribosyl-dephospho-CoA synthase [Selenomonadales bacterium]